MFESTNYLTSLRPIDIFALSSSLVGSTTLSMTYGIDVRPFKDPYIDLAEEAVIAASELMTAGNFLVDFLPVLKYIPEWFPGAVFQRKAAKMRQQASKVRELPFVASEKLMVWSVPLYVFPSPVKIISIEDEWQL